VIGLPVTDSPVVPVLKATEVTVPEPPPLAESVPADNVKPDPTLTLAKPPLPLLANSCALVPVVAGA
jgi:hypothetical protein